jgi:RNA polymerase sigma factor (sigma-70 family)
MLYLEDNLYGQHQMYKLYVAQSGETSEFWLTHLRNCLQYAMEHELSDRQRQILNLYLSGYNGKEIANELNVHESTVSRTLRRGIQRLTRCVKYATPRTLNAQVDMTKAMTRLLTGGTE